MLGGFGPKWGLVRACVERRELSMLVSSFLRIFHQCLCDLTIVLAEEALLSCIGKISVRQEQRSPAWAAGAARGLGGISWLRHCFGVVHHNCVSVTHHHCVGVTHQAGASLALGVSLCTGKEADLDLWCRTCSSRKAQSIIQALLLFAEAV